MVLEAYENPNVIVTDVILDAVMKSFERMVSCNLYICVFIYFPLFL